MRDVAIEGMTGNLSVNQHRVEMNTTR